MTAGVSLVRHHLSRELPGAVVLLPLPLCWDADTKQRGPVDDEDWWTSWDHGAIDPSALVFATAPEHVTCSACLEWMHA